MGLELNSCCTADGQTGFGSCVDCTRSPRGVNGGRLDELGFER